MLPICRCFSRAYGSSTIMSVSDTGRPPLEKRNPPLIRANCSISSPVIVSNSSRGCTMVPVAIVMCGSCFRMSMNLSLIGEELIVRADEAPGARTRISAPVPRARRADSCRVPLLTPTSVRIMVTSIAMARTLSNVLTGRCARLANVSLVSNTAILAWSASLLLSVKQGTSK